MAEASDTTRTSKKQRRRALPEYVGGMSFPGADFGEPPEPSVWRERFQAHYAFYALMRKILQMSDVEFADLVRAAGTEGLDRHLDTIDQFRELIEWHKETIGFLESAQKRMIIVGERLVHEREGPMPGYVYPSAPEARA